MKTPSAQSPPPESGDRRTATQPGGGAAASTGPGAAVPVTAWGPNGVRFLLWVGVVTLVSAGMWLRLIRDAWVDALHSYAVLIPAVSAWLVSQGAGGRTDQADPTPGGGIRTGSWERGLAAVLGVAGLAALAAGRWAGWAAGNWDLTVSALGWVLLVLAGAWGLLGGAWVRRHAFAVGFLFFTVPLPEPVVAAIEVFLQHTTASVVEVAFRGLGITYLRDARSFWLDGLRFEVAQECSGIRSTLVLFITSLVGGQILLRTAWRRWVIALLVIPLGIARNTFRICVITLLTVNYDPRIIDSPLHHRGGPLFFTLSLIPFLLLIWWFRRREAAALRATRARAGDA